jgi:excisionase family DNA binding protein
MMSRVFGTLLNDITPSKYPGNLFNSAMPQRFLALRQNQCVAHGEESQRESLEFRHFGSGALRLHDVLPSSETPANNWVFPMPEPITSQGNDLAAPVVATPNQAIQRLQVSRATLYELINNGDLESYTEGRSRRILVQSMDRYILRRLAEEAQRRGRVA